MPDIISVCTVSQREIWSKVFGSALAILAEIFSSKMAATKLLERCNVCFAWAV
jgi:hypothetical protein